MKFVGMENFRKPHGEKKDLAASVSPEEYPFGTGVDPFFFYRLNNLPAGISSAVTLWKREKGKENMIFYSLYSMWI